MKIKKGFMLREIHGNYVVVAIGKASLEFNGMINLNETGAFLWKKLVNDCTKESLLEALLQEYDVSLEQATKDVDAFINKLSEAKIID